MVGIAWRFVMLALVVVYVNYGGNSERRREILCDNSPPP
jgi:hypothetical protein